MNERVEATWAGPAILETRRVRVNVHDGARDATDTRRTAAARETSDQVARTARGRRAA